jgi:TPR repeat protein
MKKSPISMEKKEWNTEPDVAALEHAATLNFAEAEVAFKLLIDRGSVLSMVNLGTRYEFRPKGHGGPDLVQSEYWYRKAIDSGSAVATLPVGYFYLRQKRNDKAREIFSIGVDRGYAPSMVRLAHLYANGIDVEKDDAKVDALLTRASSLGNHWAKISIAERYMNADGNYLKVVKGIYLLCIAAIPFRFDRKYRPWSEKLKK